MQSVELKELNNLYLSISERTRSDPRPDLWMMRAMFEELVTVGREPDDVTYAEVDVNGIHGLWCRPTGAPSDRVILYFHGGAFVGGSSASHRKLTGHLAKAAGVQALSIDYRLAPEDTFPAQLDDAVIAFRWLREQGFAAQHIVTAGDSAGGNLSITTALKLKDLGEDLPGAIISLSPWLDMEMQSESLDSNATSDILINRYGMAEFTHLLLGESGSPTDPLANPLRANLEGLPPRLSRRQRERGAARRLGPIRRPSARSRRQGRVDRRARRAARVRPLRRPGARGGPVDRRARAVGSPTD